ncbi:MAG: hypothetical protein ABJH45_15450 [Paracoccaceae bacterium]
MRRKFLVIALGFFSSSPLSAQPATSSAEALSIALRVTGNEGSETIRIQSIESSLFRNGFVDWDFELRDGETLYDVSVNADGTFKIETETDPEGDVPAFWAQLPSPGDLATVEDLVAKATSALAEADATLQPRDQYIVRYEVCEPASSDDAGGTDNGCRDDDPLEEWSVVLRADVENTDEWKNRLILFEDGQVTGISGVRIGGNW